MQQLVELKFVDITVSFGYRDQDQGLHGL